MPATTRSSSNSTMSRIRGNARDPVQPTGSQWSPWKLAMQPAGTPPAFPKPPAKTRSPRYSRLVKT
ncbi:MAG: hypothetical protein IPH09_09400 [bacterium]|nr:hypothetical protein [bacterium]